MTIGKDRNVVVSGLGNIHGDPDLGGNEVGAVPRFVAHREANDRGVILVALDRVRFGRVEVDISEEQDLRSLQKTILARAESDGKDLLLTVTLSGRGPLHRDLRRPGAIGELLRNRDAAELVARRAPEFLTDCSWEARARDILETISSTRSASA